jgi:hypothetical protein
VIDACHGRGCLAARGQNDPGNREQGDKSKRKLRSPVRDPHDPTVKGLQGSVKKADAATPPGVGRLASSLG